MEIRFICKLDTYEKFVFQLHLPRVWASYLQIFYIRAKVTASLNHWNYTNNYKPDFPRFYQNPWVNSHTSLLFRGKKINVRRGRK